MHLRARARASVREMERTRKGEKEREKERESATTAMEIAGEAREKQTGQRRQTVREREIVKVRRPTIDPNCTSPAAPEPPKQSSVWSLNASSSSSQSQLSYPILSL